MTDTVCSDTPPYLISDGWTPTGWERYQLRRLETSTACDWHGRIHIPPRVGVEGIYRQFNRKLSPGRRGALLACLRDNGYFLSAQYQHCSHIHHHPKDRLFGEVSAWLDRNPSGYMPVMVPGTPEERDARKRLIAQEEREIKVAREHYGRYAVKDAVFRTSFFKGAITYTHVNVCENIQTLRQFIYCMAARLQCGCRESWVDWAAMTLANEYFGYWPTSATSKRIKGEAAPYVWCHRLIKGQKQMPLRRVELTPLQAPN